MDAEFNAWGLRGGHATYLFKARHDVDLFLPVKTGQSSGVVGRLERARAGIPSTRKQGK